MLYIVFTTGRCNLGCHYCGGSMPETMMPPELQYEVATLRALVEKDPDAVVAFYGGEPLLRMDVIRAMMAQVPARRFVLQTNGTLLRAIPDDVLARLDTILVSLDGRPETTDANRARGLHAAVERNLAAIRPRFGGDLVARMTVTERTRIEEDVAHLLSMGFDHVHWQLNAVWSPDGSWTDLGAWVRDVYNPGVTRLLERWLDELEKGRVVGIVPFVGLLHRLETGARGLPCGAGDTAFAVSTDGQVLACPIGPDHEWNRVAPLAGAAPEALRGSLLVGEPCARCDVADACGGRCLFANRERDLAPAEFDAACDATRHLVRALEAARPRVEALVARGVVAREALAYPPFNNTTEIVP